MHVLIDWLADDFWMSADFGSGRSSPRLRAPPHGFTDVFLVAAAILCGWLEAGGLPGVSPGAPAANSCSWRVSLLLTYGHLAPGPAWAA